MSYIEIHLWDDWYSSTYEDFLQILEAAGVSAEFKDISFSRIPISRQECIFHHSDMNNTGW